MNSAFDAVFWDFGGVFTTSPFLAFNRYEREHGLPENFLRETNAINAHDNAWAHFERGDIDLEEFDRRFREETRARGHAVPGRDLLPLLAGDVVPAMVAMLDRVRAHYRVACLTNNVPSGQGPGMSLSPDHASAVAEIMARFEFVLESSRAGVRKPEPAFYRKACDMAGVTPQRTVYLDDLGINLKPAAALGMTTIKVISAAQAIQDLAQLLGIESEEDTGR